MPDADSRPSDTPIPGESPDASLPIPGTSDVSNNPRRSTPEYLQPPRLGIIHLLAWMTVAAVLFKVYVAFAPNKPLEMNYNLWIWMFKTIANSAAVIDAGILLVAKYRDPKRYFQPGHFLLFCSCLATLENLLIVSLLVLFISEPFAWNPINISFLTLSSLSKIFIDLVVLLWFALRIPVKGRWKYMFQFWGGIDLLYLVLAFASLRMVSNTIFISTSTPLSYPLVFPGILLFFILPNVFLAIAAILDLMRGPRRDWLHWLGVCGILFNYNWSPI